MAGKKLAYTQKDIYAKTVKRGYEDQFTAMYGFYGKNSHLVPIDQVPEKKSGEEVKAICGQVVKHGHNNVAELNHVREMTLCNYCEGHLLVEEIPSGPVT